MLPSLFVSTAEKLGGVAGLAALGEAALPDEPPAAPLGLEESAAMASDESANSAAAVVTVTLLIIGSSSWSGGKQPLFRKRRAGRRRRLKCRPKGGIGLG